MGDSDWKNLIPVFDRTVVYLSSLFAGDLLDKLVSNRLITFDDHDVVSKVAEENGEKAARKLLSCIRKRPSPSFSDFCCVLEDVDGADPLRVCLTEELSKSSSKDAKTDVKLKEILLNDESRLKCFLRDSREWEKVKNVCRFFDGKGEFVLLGGTVPEEAFINCYYAILSTIDWKAIITFDPDSEEEGLHKCFHDRESASIHKKSVYDFKLPNEIDEVKLSDISSLINWNRTPWFFANGRSHDAKNPPPKNFEEWMRRMVSSSHRFIESLTENLDRHKTLVVVALPFFHKETAYIRELITFLATKRKNYTDQTKFVVINTEILEDFCLERDHLEGCSLFPFVLPATVLYRGLSSCFPDSDNIKCRMPTGHEGAKVALLEKPESYRRINEHLLLLHENCANEDVAIHDSTNEEAVEKENKAFLSGGTVSFLNLERNHDVRRVIIDEIRPKIASYLNEQKEKPTPTVIELTHRPGAGGTTIARRVLWELRHEYPCAIVREDISSSHFRADGEVLIRPVVASISELADRCLTPPLILLDGQKALYRRPDFSRQISEVLASQGKKAVIFHCLRGERHYSKHADWGTHVDPKLSSADREQFEKKFQPYIAGSAKGVRRKPGRAFHYPLAAFLTDYKQRLREYVESDLDACTKDEKSVIRFVAVIQKYSGRSVECGLIYAMFQERDDSQRRLYDDVYGEFSASARNLLVQRKIGNKSPWTYDLHHPCVVDLVCEVLLFSKKRQKMSLLRESIEDALSRLSCIKTTLEEGWIQLFDDFFLYSIRGKGDSFSSVIGELENQHGESVTASLFKKAAKVFAVSRFYTNLARYYCYRKIKNFERDAIAFVKDAHGLAKGSKEKKYVFDIDGLVHRVLLQTRIKSNAVKSHLQLINGAKLALDAYDQACVLAPEWPNPLVGKVKVYIECLKWILSKHKYDTLNDLVSHLLEDGPLNNCLEKSFRLLDKADRIASTVSLSDALHTRGLVRKCRADLVSVEILGRFVRRKDLKPLRYLSQLCEDCIKYRSLRSLNKRELQRLQVEFLFNSCSDGYLGNLSEPDLKHLFSIVKALVMESKDYSRTRNFFLLASYLEDVSDPPSIDNCIDLAKKWRDSGIRTDPYVWFYLYVLSFLNLVATESVLDYEQLYFDALDKSRGYSDGYVNRYVPQFYLRKGEGRNFGLYSLMDTKAVKAYKMEDMKQRDDHDEHMFWKTSSYNILRQMKGRIKLRKTESGNRADIDITIERKEIRVYAGRWQDEWKYRDGSLVLFVLSFALSGPKAHGIIFVSDT